MARWQMWAPWRLWQQVGRFPFLPSTPPHTTPIPPPYHHPLFPRPRPLPSAEATVGSEMQTLALTRFLFLYIYKRSIFFFFNFIWVWFGMTRFGYRFYRISGCTWGVEQSDRIDFLLIISLLHLLKWHFLIMCRRIFLLFNHFFLYFSILHSSIMSKSLKRFEIRLGWLH